MHKQQRQQQQQQQQQLIHPSTVRRHHLVVGTRTGIARFCHLPSGCTGICPSAEWAQLHRSWAQRAARGHWSYTLATGSGVPVSVACVDFQMLLPASSNALSGAAVAALLRPPVLSRALYPAPSYQSMDADDVAQLSFYKQQQQHAANSGGSSSAGDITTVSGASRASAAIAAHNNTMSGAAPVPQQVVPSRAGTKHAHSDAYVVTTVYMIVESHDARSVEMAKVCAKVLDNQARLLNPNNGNTPLIVFVALSIEESRASDDKNAMCTQRYYPEVILSDVVALAETLDCAQSRVDEVVLVE